MRCPATSATSLNFAFKLLNLMLACYRFQILGRLVGSSRTRAIVYVTQGHPARVAMEHATVRYKFSIFTVDLILNFFQTHHTGTKINRMNCEQIMLLFSLHAPDPHCSVFSPKTLQVGYSLVSLFTNTPSSVAAPFSFDHRTSLVRGGIHHGGRT